MKTARSILGLLVLILVATGSFTTVLATSDPATAAANTAATISASSTSASAAAMRRFVFVVNRIDAGSVALASARAALARFADENLRAGDQAMVVEIGYSTKVLQDLSSDRDATVAVLRGISALSVDTPVRVATRQFYDSMRELGNVLAEVPGHKHVILASNEPNRIRSGKLYIDDTVAALNRGNASVHAVDLGLFHRSFVRRAVSGLSPLATETGGVYYHNLSRVSFDAAMRQLSQRIVASEGD